jgi:hypothetical protein
MGVVCRRSLWLRSCSEGNVGAEDCVDGQGYSPHFIEEYSGKTVGNDVFNVGELWTDME